MPKKKLDTEQERARARARYHAETEEQRGRRKERVKRYIDRLKSTTDGSERLRDQQRRSKAKKVAAAGGRPEKCEVCGAEPGTDSRGYQLIHLDHRHDNNVVRGWLCIKCNVRMSTIDLRYTDPELFRALMTYSLRGEPSMPTSSPVPTRKTVRKQPTLFDE